VAQGVGDDLAHRADPDVHGPDQTAGGMLAHDADHRVADRKLVHGGPPRLRRDYMAQLRSVSDGVVPQRLRYSDAKLPRWWNPHRCATSVTVTPSLGSASDSSWCTRSRRRSRT